MNDHSPMPAKALEMRQIALRCLANLALDKHLHPRFIELGIHKLLRESVENDKIYYDDEEAVCFNQLLCRFQAWLPTIENATFSLKFIKFIGIHGNDIIS